MALYIQTNTSSMVAQNNLSRTQGMLQTSFARLSSGFRINGAADDAAGLAISKSFDAQVRSYAIASRNANDAISMSQTADGAAEQVHSILARMRELAVQGSNGTLTTTDSANIDAEFQQLFKEIDRIALVATFNGQNLLAGATTAASFQVGINNSVNDRVSVTFGGGDTANLSLTGATTATVAGAQSAITTVDTAISKLSTVRAGFGAAINRFTITVSNLAAVQTNMSAALSRIRDVDVAAETASLARSQVLSQAGSTVLQQANQAPQLALGLLRN